MSKLKHNFVHHLLIAIASCAFMMSAQTTAAQGVAVPYFSLGNGFGVVSGAGLTISQQAGVSNTPVASGGEGCCPELGYAFDLRLGVRLFDMVAIEGGVIGQGWRIGTDERGGAGFGGGGLRLYLLTGLEYFIGDLDLPMEVSIGSLFGYTILGKDFGYTGSFAGFDGTIEWFATEFFSIAGRLNFFNPGYGNFVYTDFDQDRGRCLDSAGTHVTSELVHDKGSMVCSGGAPSASFFAPQLVLNFYLDVF
jgi:hypothetical protein